MKKKTMILVIVAIVLVILFVPIPSGTYKDGSSKAYIDVVHWEIATELQNVKDEK